MTKLYNEAIEFLREISQSIDNTYEKDIEEIENLLNDDSYKIAVIGEFSVGKSTFLNSIIGKRILYSLAQEATGVLTGIKNSEKMVADIIYDNNSTDTVDLSKENSYLELKSYLDKNRNDIKNVNINYPIMGIDKEVLLLDTPGLQGIREKELLVTREALKEANASLVLIDYKGLTGTELSLLQEKLKEFGRIKTKEIILIINKTSELYSNRSNEEALMKINRVVESVKNTLRENELENVKVFAVDSRDYLWGRDITLFNEVLKENDSNIKDNIKCYEDLNSEIKKKLEEKIQNIVNISIGPYVENINKYKANINLLLSDTFNEEFKKVFKENGKINFITKEDEVKVSLEYKNDVNDSILTEFETRIKYMEEELRNNKQLLNKYNINYGKEIQDLGSVI